MMEHDAEPVPGLPAALPEGEVVLWQGSPDWRSLAVHTFHVRLIALYFFALTVWSIISALSDGYPGVRAATFALWPVLLGSIAVGLVLLFAWATARATLYTITSRRLVMRVGVALSLTANIPHRLVDSAALRLHADGTGDLPLRTLPTARVSYVMLWPHVRALHLLRPQPMLRSVPDAVRVAEVMSAALAGRAAVPAPAAREAAVKAQPDRAHPPFVPAAS